MGDDNTDRELPTPELLLDEFLKDYYHLFVLVGVFGAFGAYLSSVRAQGVYGTDLGQLLDSAVLASLTLVVIVAMYIDFIFVFIYTDGLMSPTAVFSKKTVLLAFFLVPFNVLILSLVVSLVGVGQVVSFVVSLVSFVGGILAYAVVSPQVFGFFTRRAESEGYGSILGLVAFSVYNVLLFAGAYLVLSATMAPSDGLLDLVVPFSSGYATAALLYFVLGVAIMPVVMLLGFVLYLLYYRIG